MNSYSLISYFYLEMQLFQKCSKHKKLLFEVLRGIHIIMIMQRNQTSTFTSEIFIVNAANVIAIHVLNGDENE